MERSDGASLPAASAPLVPPAILEHVKQVAPAADVPSPAPRVVQTKRPVAWQEPLDAYRRLRAAGTRPALLDGAGAHPHARYAFIACNPALEVVLQDGFAEARHASGMVDVVAQAPMDFLRSVSAEVVPGLTEEAPFTAGWIGLLGFGLAQHIEPSLPPASRESGATEGLPDAWLRRCDDVVAFDRKARTATVYATDRDGDAAAAEERAASLAALLSAPLATGPVTLGGHARPATTPGGAQSGAAGPAWATSLSEAGFKAAVERLKDLIVDGDLFQANLATRFAAPATSDPADIFAALLERNPSPYMALFEGDRLAVVSGSPEQLFRVHGGRIQSRPIAGTRKRGRTPEEDGAMEAELRGDAKEQAEHTMLVDLVRNDVAKVSVPGSVHVKEVGSVERYSHVMHLASRVEGELRPGATFADCVAALFPGGTVTGAPKVRATQRILEAEPVPRGFYTGSAGYLSISGNAEWSILIRTLQRVGGANGVDWVHAGSGIVADSDPDREWREAGRKARALLDAARPGPLLPPARGDPADGTPSRPLRLGEVVATASWSPPVLPPRHAGKRVLLVDNYDSFVHNLADACAALGAEVQVVRNDADWQAVVRRLHPTHVILSPGPGWPRDAGCTADVARSLHGRLPLLGVCLGHQAIGEAFGGAVKRHPEGPVHGKAAPIQHNGDGLFAGLPSPILATRYHSLVVDAAGLGPDWIVDARLADGTVMALRHARAPTFGLQFHPESLCTPRGLELLDKFLESTA